MIMEFVQNLSFILTTGDEKQSRLRLFKNGVPQQYVFPLFSSIPTFVIAHQQLSRNMPTLTIYRLCIPAGNWQTIEKTLTQDMANLKPYLQEWKLKLSEKQRCRLFSILNNRELKRELVVNLNNKPLYFSATPKYL